MEIWKYLTDWSLSSYPIAKSCLTQSNTHLQLTKQNTKNPAVNCDLTEYFLQLNKFSPVLAYMTHHSQSQWLCPISAISSASGDFHYRRQNITQRHWGPFWGDNMHFQSLATFISHYPSIISSCLCIEWACSIGNWFNYACKKIDTLS